MKWNDWWEQCTHSFALNNYKFLICAIDFLLMQYLLIQNAVELLRFNFDWDLYTQTHTHIQAIQSVAQTNRIIQYCKLNCLWINKWKILFDVWIFAYGNDKNLNSLMASDCNRIGAVDFSQRFLSILITSWKIQSKLLLSSGNWHDILSVRSDELQCDRYRQIFTAIWLHWNLSI